MWLRKLCSVNILIINKSYFIEKNLDGEKLKETWQFYAIYISLFPCVYLLPLPTAVASNISIINNNDMINILRNPLAATKGRNKSSFSAMYFTIYWGFIITLTPPHSLILQMGGYYPNWLSSNFVRCKDCRLHTLRWFKTNSTLLLSRDCEDNFAEWFLTLVWLPASWLNLRFYLFTSAWSS